MESERGIALSTLRSIYYGCDHGVPETLIKFTSLSTAYHHLPVAECGLTQTQDDTD